MECFPPRSGLPVVAARQRSRRVIQLTAFVRSFVAVVLAHSRDERFHDNV
jgi:hypothetical protein